MLEKLGQTVKSKRKHTNYRTAFRVC
ncbi:hypothetical protein ACLK19_29465 [Escherichia coli]